MTTFKVALMGVFIVVAQTFEPSSCQELFPSLTITNPRLLSAYMALQAWKLSMVSDPNGFTTNWVGADVCNYTGVYCAPAPDDEQVTTVAGIDLNHAGIYGCLPKEIGLLKDLALLHLNSNHFYGLVPECFGSLSQLFELDLSNNLLTGPFPCVLLQLPSLKYLDIRFNMFYGEIPPQLFDLKLDALFINDNKFVSSLPDNFGNSPVSVFVGSNNLIKGCIPRSLANMGNTLDEIILSNSQLTGCFFQEIGTIKGLKVLDLSSNLLGGSLPESIGMMTNLEQLNIASNKFIGQVPRSICTLPNLVNFSYSYNFITGEPEDCLRLPENDDRGNCLPDRPFQRSAEECRSFYSMPINCEAICCS